MDWRSSDLNLVFYHLYNLESLIKQPQSEHFHNFFPLNVTARQPISLHKNSTSFSITLIIIMCGYQCDKAVTKNDTCEII